MDLDGEGLPIYLTAVPQTRRARKVSSPAKRKELD